MSPRFPGTQFAQVPTTGFYYGSVSTYTSVATGAVCFSTGPWDETNVYCDWSGALSSALL